MVSQAYDIVVVGAGISGAVIAERYATMGKSVLVIDKRDHVGGNCFDYYNEDGVLISKYGAHLFHTNHKEVWHYVNRFSDWYFYEHRVLAVVDHKLVPVPVNITTVNLLMNADIRNEKEMKRWLSEHAIANTDPKNGEEAALAKVGPELYEKIFKQYTKKQWDKYPHELDASVLNRIPVRTNYDDRYFTDTYQFLPLHGYTPIFDAMLSHPKITLALETDYFDIRHTLTRYEKLFYTGPIDQFFDFRHSLKQQLEYRSIDFRFETLDQSAYQINSVINYPQTEAFTRIVEYKHMTRQLHPKTTISREFSVDEGEPYYPVPNPQNQSLYRRYQEEAEKMENIYFVGRLANYKYFNMDEAFKNALELFYRLEHFEETKPFRIYDMGKDKRILIIDDDPAILDAMHLLLEEEGYTTIKRSQVPEAKELIKIKPDLVLMDVFLGTQDGRREMKIIKEDPALADLPVIMISAIRTVESSAYKSGADDFLPKPFDVYQLIRAVNKQLDETDINTKVT
jgi:UDP-galactopyranose mutase